MFENIQLAFQGVFGHKLRSFLTMLGIIIGIASIITIISTIKGTNEQIKQNLIGSGSNIVNVQLYQNDWAVDMSYQTPDGIRVLQDEQRDEMIALDGVADVTLYRSRENVEGFYYRNTGFSGKLYGVDDHYFSVYGYEVRSGRGFTARDFASASKNVILDETAAKTLFSSDDPIGKIVEISGEPFTVVGVVSQKSSFEPRINSVKDYAMYVQESSGLAFVPTSVWPVLYRFDEPQNVAVRATSTDTMTDAGKAVADYLTSHQIIASKATGDNSYSYRSDDLLKQAQQLQEMSSATNNQLIWIASISLLVGGVGVMNIMLVTVTERTAEIGLKKAIGAKRRRILAQFLTEASVLTGIGGLLGVLGGIGMSQLISKFMDTPTALSVPAILVAVVFSVLIGLIFGLVPAVKASKLNSLVVDAARMIDRSYPARRIRELVDARLDERFSRRLLTGVPRDKEALATTYEPIVKMHCIREDDLLLYWVSNFDGLSRTGRENGCVIRSVRSVNGENPFFADLLETLVVPIARLGNASVLPLPFKYLREWIRTQQQSERG